MASQNGLGAGNVVYNGSMVPQAGGFADMHLLMQNMETLSGFLQRNREDWLQVQEGLAKVEKLQGRLARDGQVQLPNGDAIQSSEPDPSQPSSADLQDALAVANAHVVSLEKSYTDQLQVQDSYESTLATITQGIHNYIGEQQKYINSLHKHYTELLQQSRFETVEAQLTHQAWQAGLKRVSEGVREALKQRSAEGLPYKGRIAALKEENRILRKMAGWDPPQDSESDEEEEEIEVEERQSRGRISRDGPTGSVAARMEALLTSSR